MPEILAPAGSYASLVAALRCGADAVYGGVATFSARQSAENFTLESLSEATNLCHLYGAKFYLTVNTLLLDREIDAFSRVILTAANAHVDAFIIQDISAIDIIHTLAPNIPLHASTQMTLHTPMGVEWAKKHHISRVVTARELTREEIATLCKGSLPIEVFVHGALCMCVSGQCSLSAIIGGRSANRGRCAQCCRLPFTARNNPNDHALSLKDLSLVRYVRELTDMNVASLKIEGRCKRPEYVAAATRALVAARNGESPDMDTLSHVFSRSGFTDGYYTGKRQNMFGIREKEDVLATKSVLGDIAKTYQKPPHFIPITFHAIADIYKPFVLTACDNDGNTATIMGDNVQTATARPLTKENLRASLNKLGDTLYFLRDFTCDIAENAYLPVASINAARRACIDALNAKRIATNTPYYTVSSLPVRKTDTIIRPTINKPTYRLFLSTWENDAPTLLQNPRVDALILPLAEYSTIPQKYRNSIILAPARFTTDEGRLERELAEAITLGFHRLWCENLSHIMLGKKLGFTLHGGIGLNVYNNITACALARDGVRDITISPELTLTAVRGCTSLPVTLYAYGNQPVMTMRTCPIRDNVSCRNCPHTLTDRTRRHFPITCDRDGVITLYNALPTYMADKQNEMQFASYLLLDCTHAPDRLSILTAYENNTPPHGDYTRALYFRGVKDTPEERENKK